MADIPQAVKPKEPPKQDFKDPSGVKTCPKGQKWDYTTKSCIPITSELRNLKPPEPSAEEFKPLEAKPAPDPTTQGIVFNKDGTVTIGNRTLSAEQYENYRLAQASKIPYNQRTELTQELQAETKRDIQTHELETRGAEGARIDPKDLEAAVDRWQKETGRVPTDEEAAQIAADMLANIERVGKFDPVTAGETLAPELIGGEEAAGVGLAIGGGALATGAALVAAGFIGSTGVGIPIAVGIISALGGATAVLEGGRRQDVNEIDRVRSSSQEAFGLLESDASLGGNADQLVDAWNKQERRMFVARAQLKAIIEENPAKFLEGEAQDKMEEFETFFNSLEARRDKFRVAIETGAESARQVQRLRLGQEAIKQQGENNGR